MLLLMILSSANLNTLWPDEGTKIDIDFSRIICATDIY